jgi:hypothetical protein
MSEGCGGSGAGVDLGGAESDTRRLDLGLCAGTGVGAGTGRSEIGGADERRGVGEGGSIRFWECLVLSVARGGKSCVPCGRVETGGLIPTLPGAGTAATATEPVVLVPLFICASFLYSAAAVSLDCDSNITGRLE